MAVVDDGARLDHRHLILYFSWIFFFRPVSSGIAMMPFEMARRTASATSSFHTSGCSRSAAQTSA